MIMGWSIGYDSNWKRDIGYGVPAICDHPKCNNEIDRGIGYVCGGEPYGGEKGCGLFFCGEHQVGSHQRCKKCDQHRGTTYKPKPDVIEWIEWKLTDESWQQWRNENQEKVLTMLQFVSAQSQDKANEHKD
jgi:hypothetical protein